MGTWSLISEILISRQIDHQTGSWNKFSNEVVKMVIFEFIMWKWSCDPSFCSILNADFYGHVSITKNITQKPKIAKLIIFGIFLKWRHSSRKWSKVVLSMTKWPTGHFWPYFRQKAYSGGILKLGKRWSWMVFPDRSCSFTLTKDRPNWFIRTVHNF